jgi:hypothetical protein
VGGRLGASPAPLNGLLERQTVAWERTCSPAGLASDSPTGKQPRARACFLQRAARREATVLRLQGILCCLSCHGHRSPTPTPGLGILRLAGSSSGSRQAWHWPHHSAPWPWQSFEAHAALPVWGG